MDANTFVAELIRDNEELLARLAPAATLANEVGGDLAPAKLLRVALKNEIEASEIAAMWLPSAGSVALKLALARQAGDEAKHYTHIEQRLRELGDNLAGYDPVAAGYSPIFEYLKGLQTDVERVAAEVLSDRHVLAELEAIVAGGSVSSAPSGAHAVERD